MQRTSWRPTAGSVTARPAASAAARAAAKVWAALLGVAPTFVDGDRWAQFDVNGKRIALAGTDRAFAAEVFAKARPGYHPITTAAVQKILGQ